MFFKLFAGLTKSWKMCAIFVLTLHQDKGKIKGINYESKTNIEIVRYNDYISFRVTENVGENTLTITGMPGRSDAFGSP